MKKLNYIITLLFVAVAIQLSAQNEIKKRPVKKQDINYQPVVRMQ